MMPSYMKLMVLFCLFVRAKAFYVPGVNPLEFRKGDEVELKVNSMTSYRTQVPKKYYQLPFCKPKNGAAMSYHNLGQLLTGNWIQSSPYSINMLTDVYCQKVCQVQLDMEDAAKLKHHIKYGYHNNWIVDNLPSASTNLNPLNGEKHTHYAGGFPIGFMDDKKAYIYNHVNIILDYHQADANVESYRVVAFSVEHMSIKHEFEGGYNWNGSDDVGFTKPLSTCSETEHQERNTFEGNQIVKQGEKILYTYDVIWRESEVEWSSRWDIYLSEDNMIPAQVHWFSIANSILVVIILSLFISTLVRKLRRDIEAYKEDDETGWTLVHADVFRPPETYPMLFCICIGSGIQLGVCCFLAIVLSAVGFLDPARRGSLLSVTLDLYMVTSVINGYVSSKLYKACNGRRRLWQRCTVLTAVAFPGIAFIYFLSLNVMVWMQDGGVATISGVILVLAVKWCCVSIPFVFLGAHYGYNKQESMVAFPSTATPTVAVSIPLARSMLLHPSFGILAVTPLSIFQFFSGGTLICIPLLFLGAHIGSRSMAFSTSTTSTIAGFIPTVPFSVRIWAVGIIPMAIVYVELSCIMESLWMDQYYYVFGFTMIVYIVMLIVCAEVSVLLAYNQLQEDGTAGKKEQTRRCFWWSSFLAPASTGLYIFIYSVFWFDLLEANTVFTYWLYFGYMALISVAVMLVTGTVGVLSTLWFVRNILLIGSSFHDEEDHQQEGSVRKKKQQEQNEADDSSSSAGVHADVLRPPETYPLLFCICIGSGFQLGAFFGYMPLISDAVMLVFGVLSLLWFVRRNILLRRPEPYPILFCICLGSGILLGIYFDTPEAYPILFCICLGSRSVRKKKQQEQNEADDSRSSAGVHADVLRPPETYPLLFCICIGSGFHLGAFFCFIPLISVAVMLVFGVLSLLWFVRRNILLIGSKKKQEQNEADDSSSSSAGVHADVLLCPPAPYPILFCICLGSGILSGIYFGVYTPDAYPILFCICLGSGILLGIYFGVYTPEAYPILFCICLGSGILMGIYSGVDILDMGIYFDVDMLYPPLISVAVMLVFDVLSMLWLVRNIQLLIGLFRDDHHQQEGSVRKKKQQAQNEADDSTTTTTSTSSSSSAGSSEEEGSSFLLFWIHGGPNSTSIHQRRAQGHHGVRW
eukprot:scaffold3073_cov66-Cylindrotheca_fusiformis.AAC.14